MPSWRGQIASERRLDRTEERLTEWPDLSAYHRIRNAAEILMRGKGKFAKFAYSAVQQLLFLSTESFPTEDLREHHRTIRSLAKKCADRYPDALHYSGMWGLTPKERDQLTYSVLRIFEAAAKARGKIEQEEE